MKSIYLNKDIFYDNPFAPDGYCTITKQDISLFMYDTFGIPYAKVAKPGVFYIVEQNSSSTFVVILLIFLCVLGTSIFDKQSHIDPSNIKDVMVKIKFRPYLSIFVKIASLVKKTSEYLKPKL